jgi:hypothetical protein
MGPITIWTAMPGPAVDGRPGAFAMLGDRLSITCGDGSLLVAEVGLPDRDSCLPSEFIARVGVPSGQFS